MKISEWVATVVFLLCAATASAAEQQRLAVLEFDLAADLKLDRIYLSDRVRGVFGERAPNLFVMTRESGEVLLAAQGKTMADCLGECEVETGKKLGADFIVSGRITQFGSWLLLTLRLHSTHEARLLRAVEARGKDADALLEACEKAIGDLVASLPKSLSEVPEAPKPAAHAQPAAPAPTGTTLAVETEPPGLAVSIDGESLGSSPLAPRQLAPGSHDVAIDEPCWAKSAEKVSVTAAEQKKLRLLGQRLLAPLKVTATDEAGNPLAAQAQVDGVPLGAVPGTFSVPICAKRLVVEAGGTTAERALMRVGAQFPPLNVRIAKTAAVPTVASVKPASEPEKSPAAPVAAVKPAPDEKPLAAPPASVKPTPELEKPAPASSRHVIPIVALAAGVVSASVGTFFAVKVNSAHSELETGGAGLTRAAADNDVQALSHATLANVLVVSGAVLVAGGIVAWVLGAP
jgi:hypothetical protein